MKLELENHLPDGVELTTGNPESVTIDSDKSHVIMRFAVKPIDDPHAELKAQYKRDFETCLDIGDDLPTWRLWQVPYKDEWISLSNDPQWRTEKKYRRHPHADSIIAYHKCSDDDKKRWQYQYRDAWIDCNGQPDWYEHTPAFRLKPPVISVTLQNGDILEFPEPVREPLNNGDEYFVADYDGISIYQWDGTYLDTHWLNLGMIYIIEADCQAAHDAIQAILSQRSK